MNAPVVIADARRVAPAPVAAAENPARFAAAFAANLSATFAMKAAMNANARVSEPDAASKDSPVGTYVVRLPTCLATNALRRALRRAGWKSASEIPPRRDLVSGFARGDPTRTRSPPSLPGEDSWSSAGSIARETKTFTSRARRSDVVVVRAPSAADLPRRTRARGPRRRARRRRASRRYGYLYRYRSSGQGRFRRRRKRNRGRSFRRESSRDDRRLSRV